MSLSSKKILQRRSPKRLAVQIFIVCTSIVLAIWAKFALVDVIYVPENNRLHAYVFCKSHWCSSELKQNDMVLYTPYKTEQRLLGFVDYKRIKTPKYGDTIYLNRLDSSSLDFALRMYARQETNKNSRIVPKVYLDDALVSAEVLHQTQIRGIPIRPKDIGGLNASEIHLLETQLRIRNPSVKKAKILRELWRDSLKVERFILSQNYFYLHCASSKQCKDSHELGFIAQNDIISKRMVKIPLLVRK